MVTLRNVRAGRLFPRVSHSSQTHPDTTKARQKSDQIDSELASEAAFQARKHNTEVTILFLGRSSPEVQR